MFNGLNVGQPARSFVVRVRLGAFGPMKSMKLKTSKPLSRKDDFINVA